MLKDAIKVIESSGGFLADHHVLLTKMMEAYDKPEQERTYKPGDKINVLNWGANNPITLAANPINNQILYLLDFQVYHIVGERILGGCKNIEAITKQEIESSVGPFEPLNAKDEIIQREEE